jgi:hypothetical protein
MRRKRDAPKHLARKSRLVHPSGTTVETPLLVPSFSSKGFLLNGDGSSEVSGILDATLEVLTDSMLVSAYDVHHGLIPQPAKLSKVPEITILDSGGYEISGDHDLSAVRHDPVDAREWSLADYEGVVSSWPRRMPAMIVSYDHPKFRKRLQKQVDDARDLFTHHGGQLTTMLLKPESGKQVSLDQVLKKVIADPSLVSGFSVVGVTEKELGPSVFARMEKLARLRLALDAEGLQIPIHVFGALDPISSCLYYLAGAEIFDGLTWLRYAYDADGRCVYRANFGFLSLGSHAKDTRIINHAVTANVTFLQNLQQRMRNFLLDDDYRRLGDAHEKMREAWDSVRAALGGRL